MSEPGSPEGSASTETATTQVADSATSQTTNLGGDPQGAPQGAANPSEQRAPATAPPGWTCRDGEWFFQAKVNGEDVEIPYEDAATRLRTHESSTRKYQEAKALERKLEDMLAGLTDPRGFADLARKLGLDPRELADAWHAEHVEEARLTPAEKRQRELESQVERYEREEQARKDAALAERRQQVTQREQAQLVSTFNATLDTIGAPKGERVRGMLHNRMAVLVKHCETNGIHATIGQIAKRAHADVMETVKEMGFAPAPAQAALPPNTAPKPVIPPPPAADQQQPSRHVARAPNGQYAADPRPTVSANIPGSMDALLAWKKRHPEAR